MSYIAQGFTEEQEGHITASIDKMLEWQKAEEQRRKWTLIIGGFGLLLAAIKLGVVVMPTVRRSQRLGKL